MRVLITTLPFKAHAYPRVPLAWALRAAGHDVLVAAPPDICADIAAAGLAVVPIGPPAESEALMAEIREREETPDAPDPEPLMRIAERRPERLTPDFLQGMSTVLTTLVFRSHSGRQLTDGLVETARAWQPDLVVWDPLGFSGAVAARACGAAHARLLYGLDMVGWLRERYRAATASCPSELRDDPLQEWLSAAAARYGCTFDEELVTGQWTIDPGPPWMRLPVDHHYVAMRHVSYNGRAVVPDWLRAPPKRPRVCLTLGLSHREVLGGERTALGTVLEAAAGLDAEVVATLTAEQLAGAGPVPPNVRAVDFVPLDELLPSCSAIVHQGGTGTTQTALAHGVPQVLLADDLWDTALKADHLAATGAALRIGDSTAFRAGELRSLIEHALYDQGVAAAAREQRTRAAAVPAPAALVPTLERLTAEHRGRAG